MPISSISKDDMMLSCMNQKAVVIIINIPSN